MRKEDNDDKEGVKTEAKIARLLCPDTIKIRIRNIHTHALKEKERERCKAAGEEAGEGGEEERKGDEGERKREKRNIFHG